MPWRTRTKGKGNQKGQHFFVDTKSQQQKKMGLPTLAPVAGRKVIIDDTENEDEDDTQSDKEQLMYALDIDGLSKEQRDELKTLVPRRGNSDRIQEVPSGKYVPDGDGFPVNQQVSFFDKLKRRVLTTPKKESD